MLSYEVQLVIWCLTGFIAVLTVFFNLYLLMMSLRNHQQHAHHWQPCETIILAFSLASGAHQLISYLWFTLESMDNMCLLNSHVLIILLVVTFSLKFSVIWIMAFLTFFYSTKIVIEPIHCYTRIQDIFLKHVGTVVSVIPLCGFGICIPMFTFLSYENSTGTPECSTISTSSSTGNIYMGCYLLISDIMPGILMLKSTISITVHLAIHLRHMKNSNNGFHVPKLSSEMRVIHMNLGLVCVFLCFLVVDLYANSKTFVYKENDMILTVLFSSVYTAISALVLIYGKKTYWKELLHLYNQFLDEFPCLSCLKIPETKEKVSGTPGH